MKYKIISFILITLFIFGLAMNLHINNDPILGNIKNKIIRLHVVANSDSPEDQLIKLQIRDAVIKELKPTLEKLKNKEEAKKVILTNINRLKAAAEEEMKKLGKSYPIDVELGTFQFPTKVYGSLSFPAGSYEALNIKIGEGKGKNWWCVMFPPLCFVDIAQGTVSDETMEEFKEILDENELELLKSQNNSQEDTVKIKFKLVEMAKNFNENLAKLVGKNK